MEPCPGATNSVGRKTDAKLLRPQGQHDQKEVDGVPEAVQRALHTIHGPSFCFWNVLPEILSHSEVKGPEAYRTVM